MWFLSNADQLQAVYTSWANGNDKCPNVTSVVNQLVELGLSEQQARDMFVMSKQTNVLEHNFNYTNLYYVEFLDLICRLAEFKFTNITQYSFGEKFKWTLSFLL